MVIVFCYTNIAGMAVDTTFSSGWTALMYAVNAANPDAVEVLLNYGADPNFHKGSFTTLLFY